MGPQRLHRLWPVGTRRAGRRSAACRYSFGWGADRGARRQQPCADADRCAAIGARRYQPVASWGQTGYFELTVEMLKQMSASEKFELNVRAADDSVVNFVASGDTRATFADYLHARGIND